MAGLIAALTELDTRRLYLAQGYSSLFTYCTRALHLSESAAYRRIDAARAARRFPIILEMLAEGTLTLTSVCLLSRHLTLANHRMTLEAARYCSKREVEEQVAALQPLPPASAFVRKLPAPARSASQDIFQSTVPSEVPLLAARSDSPPETCTTPTGRPKPSHSNRLVPLTPDQYKVQLTVSRATHDKLREAQDLIRHSVPTADLAILFDRALTLLLDDLRRRRWAATDRPRASHEATPASRHVPAEIKREVWKRDGGRCAFVGTSGRCHERGFLELHHVHPYADRGPTTVANLELRCRAHNAYEAQQYFGEWLTD